MAVKADEIDDVQREKQVDIFSYRCLDKLFGGLGKSSFLLFSKDDAVLPF